MPNASTTRKRRYRQRRAAGLVVLPVAIDEVAFAQAAIDVGLIAPADEDDRDALARAAARALAEWMLSTRPAAESLDVQWSASTPVQSAPEDAADAVAPPPRRRDDDQPGR